MRPRPRPAPKSRSSSVSTTARRSAWSRSPLLPLTASADRGVSSATGSDCCRRCSTVRRRGAGGERPSRASTSYLRQRRGVAASPSDRRECADAALRTFLSVLYDDRQRVRVRPGPVRHGLRGARAWRCTRGARGDHGSWRRSWGSALDPATTEVALGDGTRACPRRCVRRRARGCRVGGCRRASGPDCPHGRAGSGGAGARLGRSRALSPNAHRAAAVRARGLRARTRRLDANRRRQLAIGPARRDWPAAVDDAVTGRAGGRAAGVLQPGREAHAAGRKPPGHCPGSRWAPSGWRRSRR